MKLGPIHIIRDSTFRKTRGIHQKIFDLEAAARREDPSASSALGHLRFLLHSPLNATIARPLITAPDKRDDRAQGAVKRVISAYRKAMSDQHGAPTASMWDAVTQRKQPFLDALTRGDEEAVFDLLSRMFQTELIWGLGNVHESHPDLLRSYPESNFLHLRFTDSLVNFAEAVGAMRIPSIEQNPYGQANALAVDLDDVVKRSEATSNLDISFPQVGGSYGWKIQNRLFSIDSAIHSYSVYRLRQLGAKDGTSVAEIGGGYGCLACLMYKGGISKYAIYDLPWVNALQGYFLIMSLPENGVRLYGEPESKPSLQVMPYWTFQSIGEKSLDFVINTDSLPEMGISTARKYIEDISRFLGDNGMFYSINQEAMAEIRKLGTQNHVGSLVVQNGGFKNLSRHRYWMRQGYVEEIFTPKRTPR